MPVKLEAGRVTETVHLINWNEPDKNDFVIATILSDMDADLAALEAKLTKTRQVKQGMMQELLTERIRLI